MKTTNSLIKKLIRLSKGETLPSSELKGDLFEQMLTDGILVAITRGSRKSFRAIDEESFNTYIKSHLDIRELDDYYMLISQDEINRAEQVKIAGNSKIKRQRTFYGFLVNCYEPIHAMLAGKTLTLLPQEGTFVFIYDFKTFSVPEDVLDNYAKDMLKNRQSVQGIVDRAVEEKLAAWLKDQVELEVKLVSADEFSKLFEA